MPVTQLVARSEGCTELRALLLLAITNEQQESPDGQLLSWVLSLACSQLALPSTTVVATGDTITKSLGETLHHHGSVLVIPWGLTEVTSILDVAFQLLQRSSNKEIRTSMLPLPVPAQVVGALVEVERGCPQGKLQPFVAAYPGWQHVHMLASENRQLVVLAGNGREAQHCYERQVAKTALLEAMAQETSAPYLQSKHSDGAIYAVYVASIIARTATYFYLPDSPPLI